MWALTLAASTAGFSGDMTVNDFLKNAFLGFSGSKKRKEVLDRTNLARIRLSDFVKQTEKTEELSF